MGHSGGCEGKPWLLTHQNPSPSPPQGQECSSVLPLGYHGNGKPGNGPRPCRPASHLIYPGAGHSSHGYHNSFWRGKENKREGEEKDKTVMGESEREKKGGCEEREKRCGGSNRLGVQQNKKRAHAEREGGRKREKGETGKRPLLIPTPHYTFLGLSCLQFETLGS